MTNTMNNNYDLNKGGDHSSLRSLKRLTWPSKTAMNNNLTPFLRATNNGVGYNKLVSGKFADASDYIKYKKLAAATKSYTK